MKCPKCQYITFDSGDRCRNCGYDFSLTVETPDLDLPIKTGEGVDKKGKQSRSMEATFEDPKAKKK